MDHVTQVWTCLRCNAELGQSQLAIAATCPQCGAFNFQFVDDTIGAAHLLTWKKEQYSWRAESTIEVAGIDLAVAQTLELLDLSLEFRQENQHSTWTCPYCETDLLEPREAVIKCVRCHRCHARVILYACQTMVFGLRDGACMGPGSSISMEFSSPLGQMLGSSALLSIRAARHPTKCRRAYLAAKDIATFKSIKNGVCKASKYHQARSQDLQVDDLKRSLKNEENLLFGIRQTRIDYLRRVLWPLFVARLAPVGSLWFLFVASGFILSLFHSELRSIIIDPENWTTC